MWIWDLTLGKQLLATSAQAHPIRPLAFTRDGKLLGSGRWDGTVLLWDTGALL